MPQRSGLPKLESISGDLADDETTRAGARRAAAPPVPGAAGAVAAFITREVATSGGSPAAVRIEGARARPLTESETLRSGPPGEPSRHAGQERFR